MTSINPFSGFVAQAAQVERTQATDKSRQTRRTQELSKKIAARDDEMQHQVESSDEIAAIHDEQPGHDQQPRKKDQQEKPAEEKPHLDITA
jgi:hypothetical protein